ncbi:hypothetical protein [Alkaliphilus metalliredigens]|nr:hypothetical protein [Alkaliphilus metalliredigens]
MKGYDIMYNHSDTPIAEDFQQLYEQGYRCIYYELHEKDQFFIAHLKNFENEDIRELKCSIEDGTNLKNYIDNLN